MHWLGALHALARTDLKKGVQRVKKGVREMVLEKGF